MSLASAEPDTRFVLASTHGYGFVTRFENLIGRNKAGKAMLNLSAGSSVLTPSVVANVATDRIVAVTSSGNLLAIAANDLPELDKGKGNKPPEGDGTRGWGPPWVGDDATRTKTAAYFQAVNRNKRSIALDMKSEAGQDIVWRLLESADLSTPLPPASPAPEKPR